LAGGAGGTGLALQLGHQPRFADSRFADDVEVIERMYIFKGMWDFELARRGWYPTKK
jgi:hypothetical protein